MNRAVCCLAGVFVLTTAALAGPLLLTYQGRIQTPGGPPVADGTYTMRFGIYDEETSGTLRWSETHSVGVEAGLYAVVLGETTPFGNLFNWYYGLWLEVEVDLDGDGFEASERYLPRQRITSAAWAMDADKLQGHDTLWFQRRVTGSAPAGRYIRAINADGSVVTGVDQGVTGVSAGGDLGGTYPDPVVAGLQGRPVVPDAPAVGDMLRWNGSAWEPAPPPNRYPIAILQADPSEVLVGESVQLSLALSEDPEGASLQYAFDPTGRGVGLPSSLGLTATTGTMYTHPGEYLAAGWVRDSQSAITRAQALVSVFPWWNTIVDNDRVDPALSTSLAVVNGRPAIVYCGGADVRYIRANDADGLSWGIHPVVGPGISFGVSLAVVNGRPAVAYGGSGELKFARANSIDGSGAWTARVTVDSVNNVGWYPSLAVVNGRPAIAYLENPTVHLKYVRATDADGTAWGTPITFTSTSAFDLPSLTMINGRPAIAYSERDGLKYIRANDASGTTWGTPVVVDSTRFAYNASLALVNGHPAIAYSDDGINYVRAADATGTTWGAPLKIGDGASFISLAVIGGRPAVANYESLYGNLKYVIADDADGESWQAQITVDAELDAGRAASLAEVNGHPGIAYIDDINLDLRYTIPRRNKLR